MKFPKEDMKELFFVYKLEKQTGAYKVVDKGEWVSEGKYEVRDIVFLFEDKYYMISADRQGSYSSDYYYSWEDWDNEVQTYEVVPVEVVKIEWKAVET